MNLFSGKVFKRRRKLGTALGGAGVGLVFCVLYLRTLAPTVLHYDDTLKDSAVLQATAYVLGIGHPTGYPTYVMLTHLFTYLPVGDVAYRVNLASAVFGVAAVVALYFASLKLCGGPSVASVVAAAAGALAFGVGETFWSQAVVAEIYTLHVLFLAVVILTLLVWRENRKARYLLLASFLGGLALTHNLSSGLLLPAGFLFVLLVEPRKLAEVKLWFKGAALFVLGLLPYAYLPLRARMDPPLNIEDPSTLGRFLDLLSGGQFKGRMFAFGPGELPGRLLIFGDYLLQEFGWALVILGLLGAAYTLLRDRAGAALLGVLFFGSLLYAVEYDVADFYMYFLPTYLAFAAWVAVGLNALLEAARGWAGRLSPGIGKAVLAVLSALALAVPLAGVSGTYGAVDRSDDYRGARTIEVVARKVPPGATVIHHRSSLHYMILVQNRREDIRLWNYSPPDTWEEVERADEILTNSPVYVLKPEESLEDPLPGYRMVPVERGLLYRLVPKSRA